MQNLLLFDGISGADARKMKSCFGAVTKSFDAGETILTYADAPAQVCLLTKGSANLCSVGLGGNLNMLDTIQKGDVFGDVFALPPSYGEYFVQAQSDCTVLFIRYASIITPCANACACHSRLIHNLFCLSAKKSQAFMAHIYFLSGRTVRQKLLQYFGFLSEKADSKTVELPVTLSALADYLFIDRSAMMREISKMNKEGLIASKGRQITLLLSVSIHTK